ncbi:MAG: glycosyltransferase family 4 protein [Pirellulaceae bacterium]|nr:glycosyltransferase family 4 protein [Pirellulaceae bacterium]
MNPPSSNCPELFVTNLHRRFTGVSATADGVVSKQLGQFDMRLVGNPLPSVPEAISFVRAIRLCRRRPKDRPFSIWHVRRNIEMTAAVFARDVLRLPIRIVFTSAAQRLHSAVPRRLIARMDAVVATTQKAASFLDRAAAVVPHGVDTSLFTPADDRRRAWRAMGWPGDYGIGIVGRIRKEKGTHLFVEAMLRVLPERPGLTAVVIGRAMPGDAAFEKSLRDRIDAARLGDRFVFTGEIARQRMFEAMRALSVLAAPALYEGFGLTPLEAMASGAAVIAADTGAYSKMIRANTNGILVPIDDADALAEAIRAVTADRATLEAWGRNARAIVERDFSLAGEAERIAEVYGELWRQPGGALCREQSPSIEASQSDNTRIHHHTRPGRRATPAG